MFVVCCLLFVLGLLNVCDKFYDCDKFHYDDDSDEICCDDDSAEICCDKFHYDNDSDDDVIFRQTRHPAVVLAYLHLLQTAF